MTTRKILGRGGSGRAQRISGRQARLAAALDRFRDALAPYDNGTLYYNFTEAPANAARFYRDDAYTRLRHLRADFDPDGLIVANHPIPPPRKDDDMSANGSGRNGAARDVVLLFGGADMGADVPPVLLLATVDGESRAVFDRELRRRYGADYQGVKDEPDRYKR